MIIAVAGAVPVGCLAPAQRTTADNSSGTSGNRSSGGTSGATGSTTSVATFKNAGAVKVVFNKSNFFTNQNPNNSGCAGDAKTFYDPFTDRAVPVQPSWLKNVAVEITNSNATGGASNAAACGLSGIGSPEPKNCAAFDDLQPLSGEQSRTIMIGGYGCLSSTAACAKNNVINDIWNLFVPETLTSAIWINQSGKTPVVSTTADAKEGLVWHAGDYDEIHDQFYIYGGATPDTSTASGAAIFSDKLIAVSFGADKALDTTNPPEVLSPSTRANYAGWSSVGSNIVTQMNIKNMNVPPPLVGHSFTYGLRRDPSMKSYCQEGTAGCLSSSLVSASSTNAIALNEHEDYFLLLGGLTDTTTLESDFADGIFSKHVYIYKPHGFSNDVGTNGSTAPVDGDWMLVSNLEDTGAGLLANVSEHVMSVADVSYDSSNSTEPFVPTFPANAVLADGSVSTGVRPDGTTFDGWLGRGYHRTVYDPTMNRFYIFGGIQNDDAATIPLSAITTVPELADNDLWIYDPPALGRRPTAACFTWQTPDEKNLPIGSTGSTDGMVLGTNLNLGPNRNYAGDKFVFPPGGCLQRVKSLDDSEPEARFEHAMAFNRDQRIMTVFGGCNDPDVIGDSSTATAGNPLSDCTRLSLLDDIWVYVPPKVTEIVPSTHRSSTAGPYNASTLLANVFSIDFWIHLFDLYLDGNTISSGSLTQPETYEVLGKWIQLTPTGTTPSQRASASFVYDRAHRVYYLQGGYGCADTACSTPQVLNDLWAFSPPDVATECDLSAGTCTNQGTWTLLRANKEDDAGQPTQRMGAVAAYAETQVAYGDDFYTVTDSACIDQGPIATTDSSVNKQFVGAIYLDVDRSQLDSATNLLINLRFLPFNENTRAPAYSNAGTTFTTVDDSDASSTNDQAVIRVQLLNNPLSQVDQIQSLIQPRYHEFISGAEIKADTFMYVSGATGQVTEKQVLVPLTLDSNINLIKIERVQGSVKFYEMTVTKF